MYFRACRTCLGVGFERSCPSVATQRATPSATWGAFFHFHHAHAACRLQRKALGNSKTKATSVADAPRRFNQPASLAAPALRAR